MAIDAVKHLDSDTRQRLLKNLEKLSPLVAKAIEANLVTFDDLVTVNPTGVIVLVNEVPTEKWAIALRACSSELRLHIFSNIPNRRAQLLKEAIQSAGPQALSKVQKCQEEILALAFQLESQSKIIINKDKDNDPLV